MKNAKITLYNNGESHPFRENPVRVIDKPKRYFGDGHTEIFAVPSEPDILIRQNYDSLRREKEDISKPAHLRKGFEDYQEFKRVYQEFSERVANVPHFNFLIGLNPNHSPPAKEFPEVFTIIDRIRGNDLIDILDENIPMHVLGDVEKSYVAFLDYLDEKFSKGGKILADVHLEQFMYGNTQRNSENLLYFIDIENRFVNWEADKDRFKSGWEFSSTYSGPTYEHFVDLFNSLFSLVARTIKEVESKTGKSVNSVRERLRELVQKYEEQFYKSARQNTHFYNEWSINRELSEFKETKIELFRGKEK